MSSQQPQPVVQPALIMQSVPQPLPQQQQRVRILQRPSGMVNPLSRSSQPKAFYLVPEEELAPPEPFPLPPVKDLAAEREAAHKRLDVIVAEWPRWESYNGNVLLEDFVVHNEAEYLILRNARFQLYENSKAFMSELNKGFDRAMPKGKGSGTLKKGFFAR